MVQMAPLPHPIGNLLLIFLSDKFVFFYLFLEHWGKVKKKKKRKAKLLGKMCGKIWKLGEKVVSLPQTSIIITHLKH
jgi:hypothetical protein